MNKRKYVLSLSSILFVILLLVSGATFAYLSWTSADNTLINIAVSEKINMVISPNNETWSDLSPTKDYVYDEVSGLSSYGDGVSGDLLQNATISVSWSNNSGVTQVSNELAGEAYAVYSEKDRSLRFYRSEIPITGGRTYNGLPVTSVYTGFEDTEFQRRGDVPWFHDSIYKVVFEDRIRPISTQYWFYAQSALSSIDVKKLDMSNVTNMAGLFMVSISLDVDISRWDTSNVRDMSDMFQEAGVYKNGL